MFLKRLSLVLCAALVALFASLTLQARPASQKIAIENAWARLSREDLGDASVYFDILNFGEEHDFLVSATCPWAEKTRLARAKWTGKGFTTVAADGFKATAGQLTTLGPGKQEVRLSKLVKEVSVGDAIPVTLVFAHAGRVEITAVVTNQMLNNRLKK